MGMIWLCPMSRSIAVFLLSLLISIPLILGCDDGQARVDPVYVPPDLSPTLANLTITGNTISKKDGGILKLGCIWTSSYAVSTATAYVAFSQGLNDPTLGPTGVIGSGTASGTATVTKSIFQEILPLAAVSTTTAVTTTASTPQPLPPEILAKNPLVIPTEVGTSAKTGYLQLEIPFPAIAIASMPIGKQQMLIWMNINLRRTNSLAFEVDFQQ